MVEKTLSGGLLPQLFAPFQNIGTRLHDWLAPASEASSGDESYDISLELPGVAEDDIDIVVEGDVLTVRGEKKSEREEKGDTWYFSERQYGAFSRSFRLPADANGDAIKANLKDGVLEIKVAKIKQADKSGAKKIAISKQ